jgi:biotin carboxylase
VKGKFNMTEESILVIGGFKNMHKTLKKLGSNITLLTDIDNLERIDQTVYELVIGVNENQSYEDWVNIAILLNKKMKFKRIANFQDKRQYETSLIAKKLGLKYHKPETVRLCENKFLMREKLNSLAGHAVENKIVENSNDIKSFAEKYGYPIILKPVNGWGSQGVSKISSEEAIEEAITWFKETSNTESMLVEEYINGEEYSVETFSEKGAHKVVCITKKYTDEKHFVEIGHCLPYKSIVNENIADFVKKCLDIVGIENGPTHCEVKDTVDGPKLIEINNRLAGFYIPDLIENCTGKNLLELWAKQSVGNSIFNEIPEEEDFNGYSAIWYTSPKKQGLIKEVLGLEECKNMNDVCEVELLCSSGQEFHGTKDSFTRSAFIVSKSDTFEQALNAAKTSCSHLEFVIK